MEQAFYDLDAPVERVCSAEVPMPYAKHLEEAALPQAPAIVAAAPRGGGLSMAEFRMPSLGADMDEGTVLEWLVKPGDQVHTATSSPWSTPTRPTSRSSLRDGVIAELLVPAGETVPVGTVLATITEAGEEAGEPGAVRSGEPAQSRLPWPRSGCGGDW